ncbi:MAG: hypothetical protein OSJ74_11655, partial [Clostridia bacterium]|nr:hypothetical protein [Clostridia bacterium]
VTLSCFGGKNSVTRVDADANVTEASNNAVAFLNDNGSFLNQLQGAQNECIYFGTNVTSSAANNAGYGNSLHTGAIKWRVLSKNDNKYGDGKSMLLWADYELGYNNPFPYCNRNHANYSAGILRSLLVGTPYLNAAATGFDNFTGTTYLDSIFSATELSQVESTQSLITHNYEYYRHSGEYYPNVTTNINMAYYPIPSVMSDKLIYDSTEGTITEDTSGDKLFLLDYEDMQNIGYGMYDLDDSGNQITFASKFNSDWNSWKDNYYTAQEPNALDGKHLSDYLKHSGDIAPYYFLRPVATVCTTDGNCFQLTAGGIGVIVHHLMGNWGGLGMTLPSAIRPAFLLNPNNLIYASANTNALSSTFTALSSTDEKPAYKLYIKDTGYSNN